MKQILKRIFIFLTFPVWIPLVVVAWLLTLIYSFFLLCFVSVFYWIATGKDIMKSKYNIFDV